MTTSSEPEAAEEYPRPGGGRAPGTRPLRGLTLAVVADRTVACDVEAVAARAGEEWGDLLGRNASVARLVARESGEHGDIAATRVWAATECLRKAGLPADAPLTLVAGGRHAWQILSAGTLRIATLVTAVRGVSAPVAFAVLTEGRG